ncbi:MAG: Na(+)-translocating NADH-quinone reductase subunit C [Desulfobulbaceae bacterium]
MARESNAKPFYSVLVLALVCSALVSGAAVGLRPRQEANRLIDRKINILRAAGLYDPARPLEEQFSIVETRIVELASGRFAPPGTVDHDSYDPVKAAVRPGSGRSLSRKEDMARLRHLERYSPVYLVREGGVTTRIILPVRGKGLWSTMYGYVCLDGDLTTILGINFYEHGETPGLGGEIENEKWLAGWKGKKIYAPGGGLALRVVKKGAAAGGKASPYEVDGISGATMTAKGVNDLMRFWFGEHGFGPFLERFHQEEENNG